MKTFVLLIALFFSSGSVFSQEIIELTGPRGSSTRLLSSDCELVLTNSARPAVSSRPFEFPREQKIGVNGSGVSSDSAIFASVMQALETQFPLDAQEIASIAENLRTAWVNNRSPELKDDILLAWGLLYAFYGHMLDHSVEDSVTILLRPFYSDTLDFHLSTSLRSSFTLYLISNYFSRSDEAGLWQLFSHYVGGAWSFALTPRFPYDSLFHAGSVFLSRFPQSAWFSVTNALLYLLQIRSILPDSAFAASRAVLPSCDPFNAFDIRRQLTEYMFNRGRYDLVDTLAKEVAAEFSPFDYYLESTIQGLSIPIVYPLESPGRPMRWKEQTITVSLSAGSGNSAVTSAEFDQLGKALRTWGRVVSQFGVNFQVVDPAQNAMIKVTLYDNVGYAGFASLGGVDGFLTNAQLSINRALSSLDEQETLVHELGHAIGLLTHSLNKEDVMHNTTSRITRPDADSVVSSRDSTTLVKIYQTPFGEGLYNTSIHVTNGSSYTFEASVSDIEGLSDIDSVFIDARCIGGIRKQIMSPIGQGRYNATLPIRADTLPYPIRPNFLGFGVRDKKGLTSWWANYNFIIDPIPPPTMAVTRSSIDFGVVAVNSNKTQTTKITTNSSNTLVLDALYTNTTRFSVSQSNGTVRGLDTLAVQIVFTPDTIGSYVDTLFIHNNSLNSLVKIPLSGSSPPPILGVSTQTLTLGPVALTDTAIGTLALHNNGVVNKVTVSQLSKRAPAFFFNAQLPISIDIGDTFSLKIKFNVNSFTPNGYGTHLDTLQIVSDGGNAAVALIGLSPRPIMQLSTSLIAFGDKAIYDTATTTISIANSSVNTLNIDSIVTRTSAFKPSIQSGSLSNADTLRLNLRFIPTRYGSYTDSVQIWSNSDTNLTIVDLSGNSPYPGISVNPTNISFGTVTKDSARQEIFAITNTSINSLRVDSLYTRTKNFDVTNLLANPMIKKNDTVQVTIRFKPDSVRSFYDTLFVVNNSPTVPLKIPLSGNGTPTGVFSLGSTLPKSYELAQNYPNPFNPSTTIRFGLPVRSRVYLDVYNIIGQRFQQLVDEELDAGYFERIWNPRLSSSIYFYRIAATAVHDPSSHFIHVKKMILLK